MESDRKLALGIAATILAVFGAIVALSLWGAEPPQEAAPAVAAAAPPTVLPAAVPYPAPPTPEPPPTSAGTPEEADEIRVEPGVNYLARGVEAYQSRNFGHAAAYLMAEVEERPERPYSHYLLGLSLWKAGRADEAAEAMRRATGLDDSFAKAFINLARIENDRGAYPEALEAARAALALAQDDPEALFLEGRSLRNLGERDAALVALGRSLAADDGNGYVWNLLGLTLLESGDPGAAAEALGRAAELEPEVAYVHNNLGMALERAGHRDEAMAAYRRAVDLDADHLRAAANLARLQEAPAPPRDPEAEGIAVARESLPPEVEGADGTR